MTQTTTVKKELPTYIVKQGDTLWGISKKHGIDIDNLAHANGLKGQTRHTLHIGQQLVLPKGGNKHDTELTIKIIDLRFKPIANARLKITFDGREKSVTTNADGEIGPMFIDDHAKGIQVRFYNIEGQYQRIADHPFLPLGKKRLVINSRQILLKGNHWPQKGTQRITTAHIRHDIKKRNEGIHAQPTDGARQGNQPRSLPGTLPEPVIHETRIEDGQPVHIAAPVFAEENLYLPPANEKYRKLIIASAKKYGFTPQTLAALIDAEAEKSTMAHGRQIAPIPIPAPQD